MRLRGLEIQGFKSFRERTEFLFDEGITAIVGPNGCGKSNVVDAIRWILGEQRPSSLRSSEMQDVIYRGDAGGKANFAEASLTLLNDGQLLPVEFTEVCVTRRLYRSGESEYLINREPCRLRDIRELFLGTGVGVEAYSFMEQGNIEAILHSSPERRRALFDEAAGISRFKLKKKETLRNLDRVETNLQRVQDVEDELSRRIHSLKTQAGRARRYQELQDEIRAKRVTFSLVRYHDLVQQRVRLEARRAELVAERDTAAGKALACEERLRRHRERAAALAGRVGDLRSELARLAGERRATGERLAFTRHLRQELASQGADRRAALEELAGREAESSRLLEETEGRIREGEAEIERIGGLAEGRKKALDALCREMAESLRLAEGLRREALALLDRRAGLRNRSVELEVEERGIQARHDRLRGRIETVRGELAALVEESRGVGEREESLEAERAGIAAGLAARSGKLDGAVRGRDRRRVELSDLERREAERASRLEVLLDMERKLTGVDAGVRAVLSAARESDGGGGGRLRGIVGMVAELLEVDRDAAPALDAALGARAQMIVAEDRQAVLRAMDLLGEGCLGRASFVALDSPRLAQGGKGGGEGEGAPPRPAAASPHAALGVGVEPAIRYVHFRPEHEGLVRWLLGDLGIAVSRQAALEALDGDEAGSVATRGGECFHRDGSSRGGRGKGEGGLLSKRAELRDLVQEVRELRVRIESLRENLAGDDEAIRSLEGEIVSLRETAARLEDQRSTLRVERSAIAQKRQHREDEVRVASREMEDLGRQMREAAGQRRAVVEELAGAEQGVAASEAKVARHAEEQRKLEARRDALAEECSRLRAEYAQAEARRDGLLQNRGMRQRSLEELRAAVAGLQGEIERLRERACEAERDEEAGVGALGELEARERGVAEDLAVAERELEEQRAAIESEEAEARGLQEGMASLREALQGVDLEGREVEVRQKDLEERVREELSLSVSEAYDGFRQEEVDLDAVRGEIEDLRRRIERLGNVNLEAIDQLAAEEERFESIHTQKDDLQASANRLREVIRRLDRESREKFETTLSEIRAHFRDIFRKLFGGGAADIFLLEPEDVLDSGIEIVARPPGKELLSISLLSGGEKTMTAVALLFSIFSTRPSPFCLLDEVDAALDETNVQRFLAMVREFLGRSQFIIITHNKRSMGAADVLYGVTMEEKGVSRKVSVDFRVGGDGREASELAAASGPSSSGNGNGNGRGHGGALE